MIILLILAPHGAFATLMLVTSAAVSLFVSAAPALPLWSGIAIAFPARNTALYFTKWYPQRQRAKLAASASSAGA